MPPGHKALKAKGLNHPSLDTKLRDWGHHDLSADSLFSEDSRLLTFRDDSPSKQEHSEVPSTQPSGFKILNPDIIEQGLLSWGLREMLH